MSPLPLTGPARAALAARGDADMCAAAVAVQSAVKIERQAVKTAVCRCSPQFRFPKSFPCRSRAGPRPRRPSLRFYAERDLVPLGAAIGSRDLVAVRQLRPVHQAHPLLDHQLVTSVKSVGLDDHGVAFPMTIGLVAVFNPPARPHPVTATATTTARCARTH